MATTGYGHWNDHYGGAADRVEDSVADYLGEFVAEYDAEVIAVAYRAAINAALPNGVSLNGDNFYGPYPRYRDLNIGEIIEGVDLAALVEKFNKKNGGE